MARNDIQSLSPLALAAFNLRMQAGIGSASPNPYGVPADQMLELGLTTTSLGQLNTAVVAAKAQYHAAVQDREAGRKEAAAAAAQIARTVYANPDVSSGMVSAIGLSPRSTSRTKVVPVTPLRLTATPQPTGAIVLEWSRNGNPAGVNFVVEAKVGVGEWLFVQDTTATRISISGYAPGSAVSFRVLASKNKTTSEPSAPVTAYAASAATPLRIAA